jgi:hypothetical protein
MDEATLGFGLGAGLVFALRGRIVERLLEELGQFRFRIFVVIGAG